MEQYSPNKYLLKTAISSKSAWRQKNLLKKQNKQKSLERKNETLQDEQLSTIQFIQKDNPILLNNNYTNNSESMNPDEVIKQYGNQFLTEYEKKEIRQYVNIYYVGQKTQNKQQRFDSEKGDYQFNLHDHIAYRYEIISILGKGSFGQVVKVFDHKRKEYSALKIIRNKKNFYNQSIIELNILKFIKDNDPHNQTNIVKIKDFVIFRNHVCIVFELLSINLYEFLKNNKFNGVSLELIRRFSIQILQGLHFLNKAQIIHCDLKPENILLKQDNKSGIKIVDFGSSCFSNQRLYTYIQSRFYRAPEVILGLPYGMPIDMWSFGCIICELHIGYPIFPGENEQEQLQMFIELLGNPTNEYIQRCPRKNIFFEEDFKPKKYINSRGKQRIPGSKNLSQLLQCSDQHFLDFVQQCFVWDSEQRIKPCEALVHEWILEGLPKEIRHQHLIQMQMNAPELNLKDKLEKFLKYKNNSYNCTKIQK